MKAGVKHQQTVTCVAHTLDNAIKQLTKQSDLMKAWRKLDALGDFVLSNQQVLAELRRLGQQQQRQVELKRPDATHFAFTVIEVQRCLDLTDLLH
jgi:hypothetical protein